MLIVFDDMVVDIEANKKSSPVVINSMRKEET